MKVKIVDKSGVSVIPVRAHNGDAGYDVYITDDVFIKSGEDGAYRSIIPLGFSVELPDPCSKWWWKLASKIFGLTPYTYYAWVRPRSGFSSKGMEGTIDMNSNGKKYRFNCDVLDGIVDSCYRGIVGVIVRNNDKQFFIKKGTKIAQVIFSRGYMPTFVVSDEITETDRGEGGFGSSNK